MTPNAWYKCFSKNKAVYFRYEKQVNRKKPRYYLGFLIKKKPTNKMEIFTTLSRQGSRNLYTGRPHQLPLRYFARQ